MHVAVRPWTDDDDAAEEAASAGLRHCASIPFDASGTVWWNGAELPSAAVQADLGALVACAVRVARSTALPDVVLVHTSGRRTRLSRRPAHATTRVAYLASPDDSDGASRGRCRDWVVVYDPATADVPSSSEALTFVAADGLVDARPPAQTRPLISVDGPCCASRVRHSHRALAPGPPVAHALARLLLLEGPLRVVLPDPPCGAPVTRVITDGQHTAPPALGWIDLAPVRAPHPDLADLFAAQSDDDDETVEWLASRALLYASLALGHVQSRDSYACSDLAVDLRLSVAGTQVHAPPCQAALGAYQSAVLCALEELVPGFTPPPPPADACTPRVRLASAEPAERVRAYARKVVERVRSSVY